MNPYESENKMGETPLQSWKEIAAYLQRNEVTARRWEKREGLPVHRHAHSARSSVYAYPSEIDAWRASRKVVPEPAPARPLWKIPAFALTMLLCLIMVGNGIRPQPVSAQELGQARQISTVGPADYPRLSLPSGRYLSYRAPGSGELIVRDLTTNTTRRLTSPQPESYAGTSAISRDGRWIAYSWTEAKRKDLRILPVDGNEYSVPRVVSTGDEYALNPIDWTPDGKHLLVLRKQADNLQQISKISIENGSVQVLKSIDWEWSAAGLSPDGRSLAYDRRTGGGKGDWNIYVLALDGSLETELVSDPANDTHPIWSRDGSRIFFLSNRSGKQSLWSVGVSGGKRASGDVLVNENAPGISLGIAETGAFYYFRWGGVRRNIFTTELTPDGKVSGNPPVLMTPRRGERNVGPSWSPDGTEIAYYALGGQTTLVLRNVKSGQERTIPLTIGVPAPYGDGPVWFPDGRSVLVVSLTGPRANGAGYYRVDLASGKTELLKRPHGWGPPMFQPAISRDGYSVFHIETDGPPAGRQLVRFDLGSREEKVLKTATGEFDTLALSPDGSRLAYIAVDLATRTGTLEVMPSGGGESRVLVRGIIRPNSVNLALSWTPDGRYLLFVAPEKDAGGTQILWRVLAGGGAAENMGISRGVLRAPQIRPGGGPLTFEVDEDAPNEVWALENFLSKTPGNGAR